MKVPWDKIGKGLADFGKKIEPKDVVEFTKHAALAVAATAPLVWDYLKRKWAREDQKK